MQHNAVQTAKSNFFVHYHIPGPPLPRPAWPILNILPGNPSRPASDGANGSFRLPDGASLPVKRPKGPNLGKEGSPSVGMLSSYTSFSG